MKEKTISTPLGSLRIMAKGGSLIYCNWDVSECERKQAKIACFLSDDQQDDDGNEAIFTEAQRQLREYFEGRRRMFQLPMTFYGTEFQKKVWNAIALIPYGKTMSYKELALRVGCEKGVRAVAQACGANPLAIVVACHRIIGADGSKGGYTGGDDKKEFLLNLESHAEGAGII